MKLAGLLTLSGSVLAIGPERGLPERYLYEKPNCDSIGSCSGNPGCDGQMYTAETGTVSMSGYTDYFNCRWEIRGPVGSQIKIKVETGNSFGIENQPQCGFDKLHIRSIDEKGYGRLCSSAADSKIPHNGMAAYETEGGTKIKSNKFHSWLLLDTNHLVVAFDTDSAGNDNGFVLHYEVVGNAPAQPQASIEDVGNALEDNLEDFILEITSLAPHQGRLSDRLTKLFNKFDSRMAKCQNGDQSGELHSQISSTIFDPSDIEGVKTHWLDFFRTAFNNCNIYIIRKHGNFDNTSWPRRISSWFNQLSRDLRRK